MNSPLHIKSLTVLKQYLEECYTLETLRDALRVWVEDMIAELEIEERAEQDLIAAYDEGNKHDRS